MGKAPAFRNVNETGRKVTMRMAGRGKCPFLNASYCSVLEKKLVKAAQAGLLQKLREMIAVKTLTADPKWD
jgi:hypothetical protein